MGCEHWLKKIYIYVDYLIHSALSCVQTIADDRRRRGIDDR